jgi:hypothetical protein
VQTFRGGHERSLLLSGNCVDDLEAAVVNCGYKNPVKNKRLTALRHEQLKISLQRDFNIV